MLWITGRFIAGTFTLDKAESLYEKWIISAFNEPNQKILVLDGDNKPTAFMIYCLDDLRCYFGSQFAVWKMGLLDPTNRGTGLGTAFFTALLHYHRQEGLDCVKSLRGESIFGIV